MPDSFQDLIPTPKPVPQPKVPDVNVSGDLIPPTATKADIPDVQSQIQPLTPAAPDKAANVSSVIDSTPAPEAPVKPEETTSGQLIDLLSKDSLYLRQASEYGKRSAAERGLVNSNLAGQAGESAAIAAAAPIAQADAQVYENRVLQRQEHLQRLAEAAQSGDITAQTNYQNARYQEQLQQQEHIQEMITLSHQGKISAAIQAQDHLNKMAEAAQAGDIQAQLMLRQWGFDSALSAQENLQKMEQAALNGDMQSALALQQFNYASLLEEQVQSGKIDLENVQFQHQIGVLSEQLKNSLVMTDHEAEIWVQQQNQLHQQTLDQIAFQINQQTESESRLIGERATAEAGLIQTEQGLTLTRDRAQQAATLQGQYLAAVAQMQAMASQEITSIYQTEGLTAEQQQNAAREVVLRLNSNIAGLAGQYSDSPLWDPNWASSGTPTQGMPGLPPSGTQPPGTINPPVTPVPPAVEVPPGTPSTPTNPTVPEAVTNRQDRFGQDTGTTTTPTPTAPPPATTTPPATTAPPPATTTPPATPTTPTAPTYETRPPLGTNAGTAGSTTQPAPTTSPQPIYGASRQSSISYQGHTLTRMGNSVVDADTGQTLTSQQLFEMASNDQQLAYLLTRIGVQF